VSNAERRGGVWRSQRVGAVPFALTPAKGTVRSSLSAYHGVNMIEETNSSGTAVARYSQGLNIDEPLAMDRSSVASFYEADGLGSVTSLSSSAGALAETYTRDSFGKQTGSTGSLTNPFQYTARESDVETGLYYYRARYYDPTIGRFIREDPIRFRGDINFYRYGHNRATVLRDPSGFLAWGGGVCVSGMIGAFWTGSGTEGSCMVVGDTRGNTGLLCCLGFGGGAINGVGASGQSTSVVCPTCKTICDMEGGFVQAQGFAGVGAVGAAGAGGSISMSNATLFVSGGGGVGAGAGVAILGGSCKLVLGGKGCKACPAAPKMKE
jgi:RHS repeat-associated protein